MTEKANRPGRGKAPKREKSPHRVGITTRLVEPTYDRLAASAKALGRSISEEIERRIEQSFLHEDVRETIREEMRSTSKPYDASAYASALSNLGRNEAAFTYLGPVIGKQPDCQ